MSSWGRVMPRLGSERSLVWRTIFGDSMLSGRGFLSRVWVRIAAQWIWATCGWWTSWRRIAVPKKPVAPVRRTERPFVLRVGVLCPFVRRGDGNLLTSSSVSFSQSMWKAFASLVSLAASSWRVLDWNSSGRGISTANTRRISVLKGSKSRELPPTEKESELRRIGIEKEMSPRTLFPDVS